MFEAGEVGTMPLHNGDALVIGMAGGSGSGKTTIAESVVDTIGPDRATLLQMDAYYRDRPDLTLDERARINYDHPDAIEIELLVKHLEELADGRSVDVPIYDFTTHARCEETDRVAPRPVIVVEGILTLFDAVLRDRLDLKIFVDTDADLRLARRLRRDIEERGRSLESVISQYLRTVRPMHLQFVEPSKRYADLIIPEGFNPGAVATVLGMIREFLQKRLETAAAEAGPAAMDSEPADAKLEREVTESGPQAVESVPAASDREPA